MLTFERRRNILRLLHEQPGIKVNQLATQLNVSEGTIRNDLDALAEEQKLKRVRGGAILLEDASDYASLAPPNPPHIEAKQQIARWAAELVEDGDIILLDASTTVQQMVAFLRDRRNLTIVTNGLNTAQMLSYPNQGGTQHTVILIGGLVGTQGRATGGHLGEEILERLHIRKAFISVAGFSLQAGLMERTVEQVQLKAKALQKTEEAIALVDATKIAKGSLMPFAQLHQISHFFTDKEVEPTLFQALRTSGTNLTICEDHAKRTYTMRSSDESFDTQNITIGFANQSESMPFAVEVRRGLERAAAKHKSVDLIVADNQLSGEEALRVADRLLSQSVDLVIEYQLDHRVGSQLMDKFQLAQVPVIAVDIPMVGATYFGVDNYRAGTLAGRALGEWVNAEWGGKIDHLLVLEEPRAGTLPAARIQGQLDAFQEAVGHLPEELVIRLDSGHTRSNTQLRVTEMLQSLSEATKIAIISFNADAAIGALAAARQLRREKHVAIVGQGGDRSVREEIRNSASRLIGSTANMPERYGEQLLIIAQKLLRGDPVPPAVYIDHLFLNTDNIDRYYQDS